MMGSQDDRQDRLFYNFRLEDHVPEDHCIRHDAPRAMMRAFFGVSRRQYSRLRSAFAMPATAGRYPRPAPAIEAALYERWASAGKPWTAKDLLMLADHLGLSLRAVWDQLAPLKGRG